jgi:alpha-1,3-rhamnosyl/mannosyltransferase
MASGCPVITSNISSLPELGGEAAVYVDPLEPASIQQRLLTLILDPERWAGLREAGLRNVKCFTYDATAEGTLAVYRAVSLRRSGGENRY